MITFVHTADWQIGKPFASIADPAKRARCQQERVEAIRRIGELVRQRQAAFVVVAGDLFDSPTPTNATVSAALGAIGAIGVPVLAIPGNHDHGGPDSLWEQPFFQREHARLAANLQILLEPEPWELSLPGSGAEDGQRVVFLPCPLRRRHEADDPTGWLRSHDLTAHGNATRIVVAHGSTTSFTAGGSQADDTEEPAEVNTLALDRLPLDAIDYLALGDWHGFLAAGHKAFYAGTPEIDRFPKAGQRPGQVAVVQAGRASEPRVEPVAIGRLRWISHTIDLGNDGPEVLDASLAAATGSESEQEPGFDSCLVDLVITGSVSLAARAELDRMIESWTARLLRLDLDDRTILAPSRDEIHDLAERPDDPIIARVAGELLGLLDGETAGEAQRPPADVVRRAIHLLYGLAANASSAAAQTEPARPAVRVPS
jgi:hypothetical protein